MNFVFSYLEKTIAEFTTQNTQPKIAMTVIAECKSTTTRIWLVDTIQYIYVVYNILSDLSIRNTVSIISSANVILLCYPKIVVRTLNLNI